jgi:RimJ/RimL family protein N-acetyltransferase
VELARGRLLLRSMRADDLDLYCELFCDPETMSFIGTPWTRAAATRAFRDTLQATRTTPPRALCLVLTPSGEQRTIGLCTLQDFDATRRAELGVMLTPPGRTQGFATDALIAVIAHAFAALPVDEVWVRFAVDHEACERLALRTGLIRHAEASPLDLASNLWRWSAHRSSWCSDRT